MKQDRLADIMIEMAEGFLDLSKTIPDGVETRDIQRNLIEIRAAIGSQLELDAVLGLNQRGYGRKLRYIYGLLTAAIENLESQP